MTKRDGVDGNELEFEGIALVHLDKICNAALRLTGNTSDAEDLLHETVLKGYRFFHRFRKDSNCLARLFKIMKNSYINRFRQKSREPVVVSNDALNDGPDGFLFEPREPSEGPDQEVMDKFLDDEVEQAIRSLPDEFKMVVLLSDVEGLQYKEIADILSCPIGTVRSRLSRGRRLLKRQLWAYAQDHGFVDKDAVI